MYRKRSLSYNIKNTFLKGVFYIGLIDFRNLRFPQYPIRNQTYPLAWWF